MRRLWEHGSSPPEALLKGLLGERATGCWEAEPEPEPALNGLGKSETHTHTHTHTETHTDTRGRSFSVCGVNREHSCLFKPALPRVTQLNPNQDSEDLIVNTVQIHVLCTYLQRSGSRTLHRHRGSCGGEAEKWRINQTVTFAGRRTQAPSTTCHVTSSPTRADLTRLGIWFFSPPTWQEWSWKRACCRRWCCTAGGQQAALQTSISHKYTRLQ